MDRFFIADLRIYQTVQQKSGEALQLPSYLVGCSFGCLQRWAQTRPDQTRPDQTRPDQTRPDQTSRKSGGNRKKKEIRKSRKSGEVGNRKKSRKSEKVGIWIK